MNVRVFVCSCVARLFSSYTYCFCSQKKTCNHTCARNDGVYNFAYINILYLCMEYNTQLFACEQRGTNTLSKKSKKKKNKKERAAAAAAIAAAAPVAPPPPPQTAAATVAAAASPAAPSELAMMTNGSSGGGHRGASSSLSSSSLSSSSPPSGAGGAGAGYFEEEQHEQQQGQGGAVGDDCMDHSVIRNWVLSVASKKTKATSAQMRRYFKGRIEPGACVLTVVRCGVLRCNAG